MIDENGQNLGVTPTREAKSYAASKGLDLVEVAPHARPPVCRVMDYGKYLFEKSKAAKEQKKKQKRKGPATALSQSAPPTVTVKP